MHFQFTAKNLFFFKSAELSFMSLHSFQLIKTCCIKQLLKSKNNYSEIILMVKKYTFDMIYHTYIEEDSGLINLC